MGLPGPQPGHGQTHRHAGFDEHAGRRQFGIGRTEIGNGGALARHRPISEIILDQLLRQRGINVAGNRDHGIFRPIPALVERLHAGRRRRLQRFDGADRRMFRQRLASEEMLTTGVGNPALRAVTLPLFRHHHRAFGVDGAVDDIGLGHHAGQDLQAFTQCRLRRLRQVQRIGRAGRRRLRIAVAAEGDAQPLPDPLRFAVGHVARSAEGQMLHIMGIALLIVPLHERADIHSQTNGNLPRRHAIAPHGVAQAVGQGAEPPGGIDRHVAIFVKPGTNLRLAGALLDRRRSRLRLRRQRLRRTRQQQGKDEERSSRTARGKTHRRRSLASFS